mgnify:CR=1 FL=1
MEDTRSAQHVNALSTGDAHAVEPDCRIADYKHFPPIDGTVPIDMAAWNFLRERLSVGDLGRLSVQVCRAAQAKRPSELQRLLLAIIKHREA